MKLMGGFPDIGVGVSQDPRQLVGGGDGEEFEIIEEKWTRGTFTDGPSELIPEGGLDLSVNVENQYGNLIYAPALVAHFNNPSPKNVAFLFAQASATTGENVVIDPPGFAFNNGYNAFSIINAAGIDNTAGSQWGAANVAGTLIFSNNVKAYTRAPAAIVVTDISAQVIATCFATAFGRTFAGNYLSTSLDATRQKMGIAWNAASGAVADWSGLGAGNQSLIANNLIDDSVIAMVPVGLQALVVLCRHSIWVGYPTGDANQPAVFQLRVQGIGCIQARTAVSTPNGVMFLADDGVYLFDLNAAINISKPVQSQLLADMYNATPQGSSAYGAYANAQLGSSFNQRYFIHRYYLTFSTGSGYSWMYVYDLPDIPGTEGKWWIRTLFTPYVFQSWDGSAIFGGSASQLYHESYTTGNGSLAAQAAGLTIPERTKSGGDIFLTSLVEVTYSGTVSLAVIFPPLTGDLQVFRPTPNFVGGTILSRNLPFSSDLQSIQIPCNILSIGTKAVLQFGSAQLFTIGKIRRVCKRIGPALQSNR